VLTIYSTALSANGRKVLALVRALGIEADVRRVNVYRGEGQDPAYRAVQPQGKIPALVDGDLVLWESNALLVYLAEAHGGDRFWSREPKRRADIARWLFWESSQWQPTLVPVLAACVGRLVVPSLAAMPEAPVDWSDAGFRAQASFLEAQLRGRSYLAGDAPTLADLAVAGMMTYARAARFPFAELPAIAAWYARIEAMDAWRETAEGPWKS